MGVSAAVCHDAANACHHAVPAHTRRVVERLVAVEQLFDVGFRDEWHLFGSTAMIHTVSVGEAMLSLHGQPQ